MRKYSFLVLIFFSIFLIQCTTNNEQINKLKISSFVEGSKLQEAGAMEGDYILKYNGKIVQSQDHLIQLKDTVSSEEVVMILLRDKKKIKIKVPIGQLGAVLKEYLPNHEIADDAVLIEDIGKLEWGIGMDNSFLACAYLLEQQFGSKLSYNDLLGISGYGFKFNFFDRYCPSSPDATVGFDSGGYLMEKLGYEVDYYHLQSEEWDDENIETKAEEGMRLLILDSIDRGWPVIAIDLIETPEWGLITGYHNEGEQFFCRTFFDKTESYEIAQKFPWVIMVIKGKKEVDIEPLYKESITLAKTLYETPKYHNYFSGLTAIREWINALKDEAYYSENTNKIDEISHANWWIYVSLEIARGIGSTYLTSNAEKFSSDLGLIEKLAEIYKSEANLLIDNYDMLPNQFAQEVMPWTPEMRARQIVVMEQLLELEEEALKVIKEI